MKYFNYHSTRLLTAFLVLFAMGSAAFGQKLANDTAAIKVAKNVVSAPNASVDPVFFQGPGLSGNPSCATLNALHASGSGDVRFSHIITDNELKLDFGTPNGTFPYTTGDGRIVVGPEYPNHSVTVSSSGSTLLSWSSTIQVTAVILKTGSDAFVYPYKPFSMGDTDLITNHPNDISHVTFCIADPTNPTSADGSITGRVIDANGTGISKAQLVLINGSTGEARITMTSPFGFYTFRGLDVNELYILNVSHKRYAFTEKQRLASLMDNLTDLDFVGSINE